MSDDSLLLANNHKGATKMKEILKNLQDGETLVLKTMRNCAGDDIIVKDLRYISGDWVVTELSCFTAQSAGLGSCLCQSHEPRESYRVSRLHALALIKDYLRPNKAGDEAESVGTAYIIKKKRHHQVGLMHDLTAAHLLTLSPERGDEIVANLPYRVIVREDGSGQLEVDLHFEAFEMVGQREKSVEIFVQIASHPGRTPYLGEDGLEDAFGNRCLAKYLAEKYQIQNSEQVGDWSLAPVSYSEEIDPDGDPVWSERVVWDDSFNIRYIR